MARRWFRIDGDRRWDGRWHLLVRRGRLKSGHRLYGAACQPVLLRQTQHGRRLVRSVASYTRLPVRACQACVPYFKRQPPRLARMVAIRRTVCGRDCGSWVQREQQPGEPAPCSGWHRNKNRWCEADARWAITSVAMIGLARIRGEPEPEPFFRCTYCARGYREGWLGEFRVEKLMGEPPKELVA